MHHMDLVSITQLLFVRMGFPNVTAAILVLLLHGGPA
jgi:L-lactate permease